MSKQAETKNLLAKINNAFISNQFRQYIEYIRFPHFKNLKSGSKIDFGFPFTVFTGLNGSGKSSTLHAVYGAPEGKSTGEFWFSTKVDPIKEDKGNPNCFVYGYKNQSGNIVEVLKTRVGQAKGADYWEPSRPLVKYGMQTITGGGRNPAIKKKCNLFRL